jgi:hypothetical protein
MEQVKTSTNTIFQHIYQNKANLAKELFIDTGVIRDINQGGANIAAEDVCEKLGNILEGIYLISSKPAHTMPQTGQTQAGFNFNPDRSDAEFVLIMGLTSAKYLLNKITNPTLMILNPNLYLQTKSILSSSISETESKPITLSLRVQQIILV